VIDKQTREIAWQFALPASALGELEFSSTVLAAESIAPAQSTSLVDCGLISLQKATSLLLTIECSYDSLSTSGIEVHVYASYDGMSWDTVELEDSLGNPVFGDVPFASGETVRRTAEIPHNVPYLKVTIENLDQGYDATGVSATFTVNMNRSVG
jgi:hypothetical protein